MKKVLFLAIGSVLIFFSCKKESQHAVMVNGTIINRDMSLCACCGGTFIIIGDSVNGSVNTYRLRSVPASSGIDIMHGPFPIDVELTFTPDTSNCKEWGYIITNDIRRR